MLILKYGQFLSRRALFRHSLLPLGGRSYCDFAHRWMPGPYPRTKEERDAATAKYNLIPEDYVPTPEWRGMGDYPWIEDLSHQQEARPGHLVYDDGTVRRNYGEPLSEFYVAQQYEPHWIEVPKYMRRRVFIFLGSLISIVVFAAFGPEYAFYEAKPKQYPPQYFIQCRPKVHYHYASDDIHGHGHH